MRHYAAAITELKDSEVTEWIAAKRSEYEIVKAHATRCEVWITNRNFNRSNELDTFRTQRYEAIKEKLVDLGWKMEIERLAKEFWHDEPVKLVNHKLVKQPKPLTERIWTNIKDTLIQFMVDYKARRLVREYKLMIRKRGIVLAKVMEEYAASQPLHDIFPPMPDIASLLAFREIIEDTPAEEEVTQDHFQGPMADYPMIAMEWRKSKDELLVKLINDHPDTTGNATLVTLRYAKTFFHCNNCGEPISYPRILVHRCNTKIGRFSTVDPDLDKYFEYLEERPWNHQGRVIKYDHLFSKRAEDILGDCELDLTIRNSELTEKDLRFECQLCESPNEGRWIMNWPAVMDHIHDSHTFGDSAEKTGFIKQAPFNFDELRLLYILEWLQSCPLSQSYEHYSSWVCRQCKRKVPWSACLEHYAKSHPGIIPDELTSFEHNRSPDRFMALHLDAARSLVGTTIQMNVDNPFHSYRKVLLSYEAFRYSSIGVDELARDMADSLLSPSTEGEDDFSDTEGLLAT
ncbi:hypothetical protein H0H93_013629 [Arthromyces matolae]|nr:hypothetical protein H0H93_013629 [Arthromyces matolae]